MNIFIFKLTFHTRMRRLLMNVSSRDLSCFRLSGGIMKDAIEKAKANIAAKAEQKLDESETTTEPPLVCEKRLKYLIPYPTIRH